MLTETTADFGFALMMAAARRITEAERWLRDGHWRQWTFESLLGADIHRATLGILGMGRIGQGIARRAAGFDMRVLYHNRNRLAGSGRTRVPRRATSISTRCSRRPTIWCWCCRIRRRCTT